MRLQTAGVSYLPEPPTDLIENAFREMKSKMFHSNFVPSKFHPTRSEFEPSHESSATYVREIVLTEEIDVPDDISRETYAMSLTADGAALIDAASPIAALRAFETFSQLFYAHSGFTDKVYSPYAPVNIQDTPTYEHRGLHLDISRSWIEPQDVIRTIEGLSMNKLNRLHLHATDSQSWPLEIPKLPELARKGAYHELQIWTAKDLENVQQYGAYRGVEVFLEIDMPGHTASIFHAYPDLVTAYNLQPWDKWALEPPSGQLRLKSDEVYKFLDTLFDDLLPRLKPFNSRFHLGGDEFNSEVYTLDPSIGSSSKEVLRPLIQKLFDTVIGYLTNQDMVPHIWHDMLSEWDIQFPPNTIIQAWKPGDLENIVAKGYRAIFGACVEWYLDAGYGTFIDPQNSETSPIKRPYHDWNAPYKNWRQILSYNPLLNIPEDRQHLVIGGEMCLWGELTDSVSLDFMLWPRVAAGAEVLWSGKGEVCEATTRRLAEMRERLVKRGIQAGLVQMEWGLRNPGGCVL